MLAEARIRQLHIAALGVAVVLALVGLLALGGAGDTGARLLVMALLVALVALEGWLWWQGRKLSEHYSAEGWQEPTEVAKAPRMTIRCKQCGEVFPVEDTGSRPLVAACPHCGKSGTIKVRQDAA
jgi:hypothetical protein